MLTKFNRVFIAKYNIRTWGLGFSVNLMPRGQFQRWRLLFACIFGPFTMHLELTRF